MTIYTLFLYIGIVALGLTLILGLGHAKLKKYVKMRPLLWFIQYFVGALLIFSGLVKAVDPLGTAYKMADYFTLLLPVLSFMKPFALPFALFMIVLEIVLGLNLILGHGKRWTTSLTLLMMLFFTFLTGYNYLTGYLPEGVGIFDINNWQSFKETSIRVSDCGCFGDFMVLLPIETFMKDILLTGMSIFLFVKTNDLKFLIGSDTKVSKFTLRGILTSIFTVAVTVFCYLNFFFGLPMVDFRPFYEGSNIGIARAECSANPPVKKIYYIYKNKLTDQKKIILASEIANHSYTWTEKMLPEGQADSVLVWEIQSDLTKEELVEKGCDSKVMEMDASKQQAFASHSYALLIVADEINQSLKGPWKKVKELTEAARKDGVEATAMYYYIKDSNKNNDNSDDLEIFRHENQLAFDFIQSDEKLVKTIIRSSPGIVLLHNGTIVKKWHHRQLPSWDKIKTEYIKKPNADFLAQVQIKEYNPEATQHVFKCTILNVEKGQISSKEFNLIVLDANYSLLKQLLDEDSESGAVETPLKLSFAEKPNLFSKNPKVNFVPNGFRDEAKAFQIIEIIK